MSGDNLRWSSIACIALLDFALAGYLGIRVVIEPWFMTVVAVLAITHVVYRFARPEPRLADLSKAIAQHLGLGLTLTIASCLFAALQMPLIDTSLSKLDTDLGFNWMGLFSDIHSRWWLAAPLHASYNSLIPQTAILFLWLNVTRRSNRIFEFVSLSAITLGVIVAVSAIMPAAGTFKLYDLLHLAEADYVTRFFNLRDGAVTSLSISQIDGIVQFPSFHAALGILFVYASRGVRILFPCMVLTNVLMIVSTPVFGGHYFADVIAGGLIASLIVIVSRRYRAVISEKVAPA